ncbi:MAG TPA: response regulator, partial [Burkholderiales bacterium]|nr:response regulator [Burkholderiales bacterium]
CRPAERVIIRATMPTTLSADILNVEDDSPARFLKSRILERAGFRVVEAVTAADAVRSAAAENLRLVLLDLRLPDGDGFMVCEQIKASRPSLPVVMITSTYGTAQGRQDGLASGADAYLIEPVPAERLVQVVRRFLEPGLEAAADVEAWIVTDDRGVMVEISGPGHRLLNLSARGALGRALPPFFDGERHQVFIDISRALEGQVAQRKAQLRPRDRRPFTVSYEICRESMTAGDSLPRLRWVLEPVRTSPS